MPLAQCQALDSRRKAGSQRGVDIPHVLKNGTLLVTESVLRRRAIGRHALNVQAAIPLGRESGLRVGADLHGHDVAFLHA